MVEKELPRKRNWGSQPRINQVKNFRKNFKSKTYRIKLKISTYILMKWEMMMSSSKMKIKSFMMLSKTKKSLKNTNNNFKIIYKNVSKTILAKITIRLKKLKKWKQHMKTRFSNHHSQTLIPLQGAKLIYKLKREEVQHSTSWENLSNQVLAKFLIGKIL